MLSLLTQLVRRGLCGGMLLCVSFGASARAQSCTYGLLDHTSPVPWKHQLCAVPTFTSTPLNFAAPGTYPSQYLGELQGGSLNSTATVNPSFLGNAAGVSIANLVLNTTPPSTAQQGTNGQYIYGDVTISATTPSTNLGLVLNVMQEGVQVLGAVDALTVQTGIGSPASCPTDVTTALKISSTPPVRLFGTQLYTQLLTFKNISGSNISGPIFIALRNLSNNAQLFAGNGTLSCSSLANTFYQYGVSGLAAGASANVVLTFTNSLVPQTQITYQPVVLAGAFQQ